MRSGEREWKAAFAPVSGMGFRMIMGRYGKIQVALLLGAVELSAQAYCDASSRGNAGNGYHYELWTNGTGSVCLTLSGQDAGFKTVWSDVGNFVARVGLAFDQTKTPEQLGTLTAEYAFTKSGVTRLAYMGIYGWTVNPLVEYYIVEDWNEWRPSYAKKGTVILDGDEYDIMTNTQVNQPSIKGNTTFTQWWSVRKTARQSGTISISSHFAAWRNAGAQLGQLYESKLKVEGMNGSGTVEFTKAKVTVSPPGAVLVPPGADRGRISRFRNGDGSETLFAYALNGKVLSAGHAPPGMYVVRGPGISGKSAPASPKPW